jgi:hypothetical protein
MDAVMMTIVLGTIVVALVCNLAAAIAVARHWLRS